MPIIERLNECLDGDWAGTLAQFRVRDIPTETEPARPLLICESPHVDEVTDEPIEHRYPLMGAAGRNVTKALIECAEPAVCQHGIVGGATVPVGLLVAGGQLDSIRIVNVCELPLQSGAYVHRIDGATLEDIPEELTFKEWCRLLLSFRNVRESNGNVLEIHDPLIEQVLCDFRDRLGDLQQVRNRPALVCGKAAQACWRHIGLPAPNDVNSVKFVAHPSWYSNWFDRSGDLKTKVREALIDVLGRSQPARETALSD